jgi:hypothetical protein
MEHGVNACYISSALFAMFAAPRGFDTMLRETYGDPIPLRLLKRRLVAIVHSVRTGHLVSARTIEAFREACWAVGWHRSMTQQDSGEFMAWLIDSLRGPTVRVRCTVTVDDTQQWDEVDEMVSKSAPESVPFIPVPFVGCEDKDDDAYLNVMLDSWFFHNVSTVRRRVRRKRSNTWEETDVRAKNVYVFENPPPVFPILLNRFNSSGVKNQTRVVFPETLNYGDGGVTWELRAAICHIGDTRAYGHYRTISRTEDGWTIMDDTHSPPLRFMTGEDTDVIMSEAYVLLYTRNA